MQAFQPVRCHEPEIDSDIASEVVLDDASIGGEKKSGREKKRGRSESDLD